MYKRTFSTILLLYFFFSNWKQGIAGWTALSSPGAPLVDMATTFDATGGIWGRWLCGLRFSLVFSARLIWHLHPINRALPSATAVLSVWWSFIFNARCTSFKCLIYVLNLNSLYIYSYVDSWQLFTYSIYSFITCFIHVYIYIYCSGIF